MIRTSLFALSLFAAACAADSGPAGHIRFAGSRGTEFRVTPNGISNERVNVSRVEGTKTFRGVIGGSTEIEVRAEGDVLKGERASTPIELHLEKKSPTSLVIHGMYGGELVSFHLLQEPNVECAFRYDEKDPEHAESCATEPAAMAVPMEIRMLPMDEKAILFAIAFGEVARIK